MILLAMLTGSTGSHHASGYYAMPEATLEAFRNLWFHTGDVLKRDGDGYFYFIGRRKDMVRRRGENISTAEVEMAIEAHPDVPARAGPFARVMT